MGTARPMVEDRQTTRFAARRKRIPFGASASATVGGCEDPDTDAPTAQRTTGLKGGRPTPLWALSARQAVARPGGGSSTRTQILDRGPCLWCLGREAAAKGAADTILGGAGASTRSQVNP